MVRLNKCLLCLGLVGSMLYIMMSSYKWKMSQEKKDSIIEDTVQQQQEQRKQLLKDVCHADEDAVSKRTRRLEEMRSWEFKNLIVDDKHGILYCYIPKVACSNWKRVMLVLKNGKPYSDPLSIDREFVHSGLFPLLSTFSMKEIEMRLNNYTKFMFVRDPFVRVISAYRDKFEKNDANEYFYTYAKLIMRLYGNNSNPPKTVGEAFKSGVHPSFHNFIQYLVDLKTQNQVFDPHWRQMYRLCHPCLIQYDFIGHQETLTEDAEVLLRVLKLQDDIKFPPSYENMTSSESVMNWFKTVPPEDRRKLYKVYEGDFKLFGYRRPDELLDG